MMKSKKKKLNVNIDVPKRLYNVPEAAKFLGCKIWSVRTLIWRGHLPYIQTGRKQFIDSRDLESYIEKNKKFAR